ncbi:hypothetical protein ACWEOZ_33410 [Actinoplanes sp. NPDC004185]
MIDTHTLKETDRYSTGARTCPTHLVQVGELLWFGGCDGTWSGGVGRVKFPEPVEPDPSASPSASPTPSTPPKPTIDLNTQGDVRFQRPPWLAAHDDAAGLLVAAQLNLSLSTVYVYDRLRVTCPGGCSAAVTPAGCRS